MKNVLAFFGAFNPPTRAHVSLAKMAMDTTGRDGVIFVPSKSKYITETQEKDFAFQESLRLEMLNDLALYSPWMAVSRHDIDSDEQPRTYETLCFLKQQGYEPSLLVGTDVLEKMEREWLNVDKIANEFGIVCITRGDYTEDIIKESDFLSNISKHITLIPSPKDFEMSSTGARCQYDQAIMYWKGLCNIVPPEVSALLLKEFAEILFSGGNHDS